MWFSEYRKEKRRKLVVDAVKKAVKLPGTPSITVVSFSQKLTPELEKELKQYLEESTFVDSRPLPPSEYILAAVKNWCQPPRYTAEDFLRLADLDKNGHPLFRHKTRLESCVSKMAQVINTFAAFTYDEVKKPSTWHTWLSDGCGGYLPTTVKLSFTVVDVTKKRKKRRK
jgi:hypothetical protein